MIARREWVDEAEAWEIIKPAIRSSLVTDLEAVINEATAAGRLRSRPCQLPYSSGDLEYHVGDLEKELRRPTGRPSGTCLDAAGDRAIALLARSIQATGMKPRAAVREAIAQHRAAGLPVAGNGVELSTVKRIEAVLGRLSE